jgi:hypothetical protein
VTLPLADIRVVSVEQFGAGPWGTLQLADLGAEIIKIEDPGSKGDVGRFVPPFQEGEDSFTTSSVFATASTRISAATSRRGSGSPTTSFAQSIRASSAARCPASA